MASDHVIEVPEVPRSFDRAQTRRLRETANINLSLIYFVPHLTAVILCVAGCVSFQPVRMARFMMAAFLLSIIGTIPLVRHKMRASRVKRAARWGDHVKAKLKSVAEQRRFFELHCAWEDAEGIEREIVVCAPKPAGLGEGHGILWTRASLLDGPDIRIAPGAELNLLVDNRKRDFAVCYETLACNYQILAIHFTKVTTRCSMSPYGRGRFPTDDDGI